jgi:hypothetical protein
MAPADKKHMGKRVAAPGDKTHTGLDVPKVTAAPQAASKFGIFLPELPPDRTPGRHVCEMRFIVYAWEFERLPPFLPTRSLFSKDKANRDLHFRIRLARSHPRRPKTPESR